MAKGVETETSSINIIGNGSQIKGDIISTGDMRIDGILIGNIELKGKLVVGATGRVEGNIICQSADFSGVVKGNSIVNELLVLQNTSNVMGDITIAKLSIEPGALFSGHCKMESTVNN